VTITNDVKVKKIRDDNLRVELTLPMIEKKTFVEGMQWEQDRGAQRW